MKKQASVLFALILSHVHVTAQVQQPAHPLLPELFFVSDTQQPMWVEKIVLKANHNLRATEDIFANILKERPQNLYMLGDVVSLGFADRKWKKVDRFLDSCQKAGTTVCGLLGNHDVMGRRKKGEKNFQKRFPMNVRTGYVSVTDSVAVIMLNSNFNTLTPEENDTQQTWYKSTLASLDSSDEIKAVIVCCHHAPFTNSKIVGCSKKVQEHFVTDYIQSKKGKLFITGHAHAFEHFKIQGKDFVVIGGGGGLHQPLSNTPTNLPDLAVDYKPNFHYLAVKRIADNLSITSHELKKDFSGFMAGLNFSTNASNSNMAITDDASSSKTSGSTKL